MISIAKAEVRSYVSIPHTKHNAVHMGCLMNVFEE